MSNQEKGNLKSEDPRTNYPKLMMEMNGGTVANVIGAMLTQLGWSVANTNRAGELNIKLKISPDDSVDNSYLKMATELKIKEPKMTKGYKTEDSFDGTIVWVNKQGKMSTVPPTENHNGQMKLATETEEQVQIKEVR
jgi:hypothetical protein